MTEAPNPNNSPELLDEENDPVYKAFVDGYAAVIGAGLDPNSGIGKQMLLQILSSAGQEHDGTPPLPGTFKTKFP